MDNGAVSTANGKTILSPFSFFYVLLSVSCRFVTSEQLNKKRLNDNLFHKLPSN